MTVGLRQEAEALVERAILRHGGERWTRLARLTLRPLSLTGFLPWLKGNHRTFELPPRIDVEPRRSRAVFSDYPGPGEHGLYQEGRVAIGAAPLAEHRATFDGWAKWRLWSPLDALYFFGYALTHYHSMPWSLREAEPLRLVHTRRSGASHALTVRFPERLHTHSAVQTVYFDPSGLIVRHDYVAEIIGHWASGAHLWRDFAEVDGFPIATHRRVLARLGTQPMPLVALDARLAKPEVALV